MSGIFVSYRRDDTAGHAGRLFDHLSSTFGADDVFMDVDDIRRGENFAETLAERLKQSDVLLAVIGRQWLTLTDAGGMRRLDKADDWVRAEISAALSGGLLVIPVLVGGAALPKAADLPNDIRALGERQMADVRDGSWSDDITRLCMDIKRRRARGSWAERLREHRVSAAITLSLVMAAGGFSAYTYLRSSRAAVPPVGGLTLPRATQAITAAGLNVGEISKRATNDYPPDSVLAQNPATATEVRKGASVALTVAAPKSVDLARYVTVKDVGSEGTVAAAACAMAMEASLGAQGRPVRLSMRYIYEKAKRHDELAAEGTLLETALYVARQFGAPPETRWPYRPLHRRMPAGVTWADLDSDAAEYKASVTQVPTLDGVLGALDKGMAVIVTAEAAGSWGSDLSTKTGVVKPAGAGEPVLGRTAITIVGYDTATRRYKFANNWGPDWGDNGFGYFDSTDANALLLLQSGLWAVAVPPAER